MRRAVGAVLMIAALLAVAHPALGGDLKLTPLASWAVGHDLGPHVEGIAATASGAIAVADRTKDRVVVFSRDGRRIGGFPATDPRDVAALPGGGYLVSEPGRVRRVDDAGATLRVYPADDPYGVAVAGDLVLIAEDGDGRILRFAADGSPAGHWAAGLQEARGLAVAPDGHVYAVDAGARRVVRLDGDGTVDGGWAVPHAHDVAVGPDGTVFVAADRAHVVRVFSADGAPAAATVEGLSRPRAVTVDCRGTLTVADNSSRRLSSYGDPAAPAPPCLAPVASPSPEPPPPPPAPVRPAAIEQPQLGLTAAAVPVSGAVYVGQGEKRRELTRRTIVPVETYIDATDGAVELTLETAAEDRSTYGRYQEGVFGEGAFTVHQAKAGSLVELRLDESPTAGSARARASQRRKRTRLWGSARGRFRTTGRHGAATVRGTRWLTEERAAGTYFRVTEGYVLAEAFERGRRRLLGPGESFLARPACVSRRSFRIRLRIPVGTVVRSAVVTVGGRRVKVTSGARLTAPVDLRGLRRGIVTVQIRVVTAQGTVLSGSRRYRTCAAPRSGGAPPVL